MLKGLDVSSYQGSVPWQRVASEMACRFALVKVAEGLLSSPDPWAARSAAGAREAGLVIGGYFFLHAERDVEAQAKLHFKLASDLGVGIEGDLPFAVDFESPEPTTWASLGLTALELRQRGLAYCQAVRDLSGGVAPFLYTYPDFWRELQGATEPRFATFPLWQAAFTVPYQSWPVDGQSPNVLRPWTSWCFWQFSDRGKLPGGGGVDLDVFWGEETDLQALRKKNPGTLEGTPEFVVPDPTST